MGGLGESCFLSCTPQSPHVPDGPIPSLATHRDDCTTPSSCCHSRWESCSMPRARMGWGGVRQTCPCGCCSQGWQQTDMGCGAAPPPLGCATDQHPLPPPFSAGNETSSNYSSQARKSDRSRGPGLTQLRSAVSGRTNPIPPSPLVYLPRRKQRSYQLRQQ